MKVRMGLGGPDPKRSVPGRLHRSIVGSAVLLAVAGCDVAREGEPAYELAQQCVSVRSHDGSTALTAGADGTYSFLPGDGEAFFLKPAALGEFLLHDTRGRLAGVEDRELTALAEAKDEGVWEIREVDLTLAGVAVASRHSLIAPRNHRLTRSGESPVLRLRTETLVPETGAFQLVELPEASCLPYPEASLDAVVDPAFHEPRDPDEPIVGWADVHAHFGFPRALAGLALAGEGFHRFGVPHALGDCDEIHGENGAWDFLGQQGGSGGHDTTGYPDFDEWPSSGSYTHNQAYYRWIERAYLSGLRLAVNLATGNSSFCQAFSTLRPRQAKGDCSPATTVELQSRYMYEMQDYVDAQSGGPGKGWFRVVTSPAEARAAIAQNKLAVVLGVEYGTLFDCRIGEEEKCTLAYIDEQLSRIHALGIRSAYPIHRFENGFGGARPGGGDSNAWMNLANKLVTGEIDHITDLTRPGRLLFRPIGGQYWDLDRCPEGVKGATGFPDMREWLERSFPDLGALEGVAGAVFFDKLAPFPDYGSFGPDDDLCNQRGLTEAGRFLIRGLMDRGMIISVDHMSWDTLLATLDMLETARYSGVISDHGWTDAGNDELTRVLALGGILAPMKPPARSLARHVEAYRQRIAPFPYLAGLPVGTDVMGVTGLGGGDSSMSIEYPFTSHDGSVTFTRPSVGNRTLDFQREGMVHYGLHPEWLEQLRQVDEREGGDALSSVLQSAEAYVQMWERAEAWAEAAGSLVATAPANSDG